MMQCNVERSQQMRHTVPRKTLSASAAYDACGSLMANATHCLRRIDSCITQLKAQGPRTCNESKEECNTPCSVERGGHAPAPWWTPRPESGRDCLIRAEFARQRSLENAPCSSECVISSQCGTRSIRSLSSYRGTSLIINCHPHRTTVGP